MNIEQLGAVLDIFNSIWTVKVIHRKSYYIHGWFMNSVKQFF